MSGHKFYAAPAATIPAAPVIPVVAGSTGALGRQEGGSHYRDMPVQPAHYIMANGIGWAEGSVIQYVSRWRAKGGLQDLKKARHLLDMLIEHVEGEGAAP